MANLPRLETPNVRWLRDRRWVGNTPTPDEGIVRHIVPSLRRAGARGIVEYPLSKIID